MPANPSFVDKLHWIMQALRAGMTRLRRGLALLVYVLCVLALCLLARLRRGLALLVYVLCLYAVRLDAMSAALGRLLGRGAGLLCQCRL